MKNKSKRWDRNGASNKEADLFVFHHAKKKNIPIRKIIEKKKENRLVKHVYSCSGADLADKMSLCGDEWLVVKPSLSQLGKHACMLLEV